jgi:hypothetical protein
MNCLRAECVESSDDRILGHEVRMFKSEPLEVTAISDQLVRCIFKARRVNFRRICLGNSIGDILPSGSRREGRL